MKTGVSFEWILTPRTSCTFRSITDACLTDVRAGLGGYHSDGERFQIEIRIEEEFPGLTPPDINWFEMAAIVIGVRLWHKKWYHTAALLLSDNMPAVCQLYKQSCTAARYDTLLLVLQVTDLSLRREFHYWTEHIAGERNRVADALSRFYTDPWVSLSPEQQRELKREPCDARRVWKDLAALYRANARK